MRLSEERLRGFLAMARAQARSFTDPPTATVEVRAVELVAVLEELAELRAAREPMTPPVSRAPRARCGCGHPASEHWSVGCRGLVAVGQVCRCTVTAEAMR